ncbi:MAG: SpaA isopeptide-forming pilin-related protein, partial [Bifidobacteriaceae bacterium]|nr:SpaA isopeptide-forming pilin-related protein [Bifidobacteriaceae bacterium]
TGNDDNAPSRTADNSPVSLVITQPIAGDVTLNLKSSTPVSHKNIVDAPASGKLDEAGYTNQRKAAIVDENTPIHYQLTFQIPSDWVTNYKDNGFWFTMNDTLDSSLVYDRTDAIMVGSYFATTSDDTAFSATSTTLPLYDKTVKPDSNQTDSATGKTALVWRFGSDDASNAAYANNKTNLKLAGKVVKLYYTAHLSSNAPINTAIGNEYDVTYQHNPSDVSGGEKTPAEHPYVYTYNLVVNKQDGNTGKALEGVEFQMYSDKSCKNTLHFTKSTSSDGTVSYDYDPNGTEATLVTDAHGAINVEGLAATSNGTAYYVKETKTVDGYRMSNAVITATITAKDFDVQNDESGSANGKNWTIQDGAKQTLTYELAASGDHSSVANNVLLVKNYRGILPTTGAQGIALMCAVGALLIAGGVLLLRKRQ